MTFWETVLAVIVGCAIAHILLGLLVAILKGAIKLIDAGAK